MTPKPLSDTAFQYVGCRVAAADNRVDLDYRANGVNFRESFAFPGGGDWTTPAVRGAVRLLFLVAGVSYYKTAPSRLVDVGRTPVTAVERTFLTDYYLGGLGEFAYRNGIDLSGLAVVGPEAEPPAPNSEVVEGCRPLVPFGGGLDSIVSVELLRRRGVDSALFVVNRPGDRFTAIEEPARVTGLPVVRAQRTIDEKLLRSRELGFMNGHVPVTAIISAAAVVAAALGGHDSVVMSNEWSASSATVVVDGRPVNHQFSKSGQFESALRFFLAQAGPRIPDYFSLLRPFSELWIAEQFATHPEFFDHFRSCNRAFHIDRSLRWDHWCGECDKCCFIDLILAPFLSSAELQRVFGGAEPLDRADLLPTFRRLLGLLPDSKPWECVGDEVECRAAARMAADRTDRAGSAVLESLVRESGTRLAGDPSPADLMRPLSDHYVPDRYAPDALLV